MTTTNWHVGDEVLSRYGAQPRSLDHATASSVEAHLLACSRCRSVVGASVEPASLDAMWDRVADSIDRPRRTVVERVLAWLGLNDSIARLVAATPALQLAWLAAMAVVVAATVAVSRARGADGLFLMIAPLVPLASVAAAFRPGADPAGEAGLASPLAGLGLVLRRAVAVLASSLLALAAGATALPGLELADAAWVLPALALSLASLAAGTRVRVEHAAAGLATVWLLALWTAFYLERGEATAESLAPLAFPGQLAAAAVAAVAIAVLAARRHTFTTIGGNP